MTIHHMKFCNKCKKVKPTTSIFRFKKAKVRIGSVVREENKLSCGHFAAVSQVMANG